MMTDIKVFKFTNGEVVIGQLLSSEDGVLTVKNPVSIQAIPGPNGQAVPSFVPWPTFAAENVSTVEISRKDLVVAPYEPFDPIKGPYDKEFGSGLILPNDRLTLDF